MNKIKTLALFTLSLLFPFMCFMVGMAMSGPADDQLPVIRNMGFSALFTGLFGYLAVRVSRRRLGLSEPSVLSKDTTQAGWWGVVLRGTIGSLFFMGAAALLVSLMLFMLITFCALADANIDKQHVRAVYALCFITVSTGLFPFLTATSFLPWGPPRKPS